MYNVRVGSNADVSEIRETVCLLSLTNFGGKAPRELLQSSMTEFGNVINRYLSEICARSGETDEALESRFFRQKKRSVLSGALVFALPRKVHSALFKDGPRSSAKAPPSSSREKVDAAILRLMIQKIRSPLLVRTNHEILFGVHYDISYKTRGVCLIFTHGLLSIYSSLSSLFPAEAREEKSNLLRKTVLFFRRGLPEDMAIFQLVSAQMFAQRAANFDTQFRCGHEKFYLLDAWYPIEHQSRILQGGNWEIGPLIEHLAQLKEGCHTLRLEYPEGAHIKIGRA